MTVSRFLYNTTFMTIGQHFLQNLYKFIDRKSNLCNNINIYDIKLIFYIFQGDRATMKNDKEEKENRLLNTAFKLFTEKGLKETSIQEIVDNASVAKGTFYLYFRDKYEIRDILIVKKSQKLFSDALKSLRKNYISNFSDSIIYIINYVIDELTKNPLLLKFISKNLSWGVFSKTVLNLYDKSTDEEETVYDLFLKGIEENNIKLSNPEVTFFMIIELVGSTCFNSILYKEPLPIKEYKPYLYKTIRNLIKDEEIKK